MKLFVSPEHLNFAHVITHSDFVQMEFAQSIILNFDFAHIYCGRSMLFPAQQIFERRYHRCDWNETTFLAWSLRC